MSFPLLRELSLGAFLALAACGSESDEGSSTPPPAPETLFDTLPAATPNKLRGVWESKQEQANGTIEIRVRFIEKYVVGAARCTVKGQDTPVVAGGSIGLDTTALDAAEGQLTMGALALDKVEGNVKCQVVVPANTYNFKVEDTTLSLTTDSAKLELPLTKVGD